MQNLPQKAGLGFKPEHFHGLMAKPGVAGFLEIHAENYMGKGGAPHAMLTALRADHALSIHGVGLSIGGADGLNPDHLARLRILLERYQPESFSEHLAWSSHGAEWLNDLLPLPYTDETLATVCAHIDQVQSYLGRRMLLENPATYATFAASTWSETDFLAEIVRRTGCGVLLDVNNVFVSATNNRFDAHGYLAAFPLHSVGEIHLAGHDTENLPSGPLLIDNHAAPVADPVWALYADVLMCTGPVATLIEWDNDVPTLDVLLAEVGRVDALLVQAKAERSHAA